MSSNKHVDPTAAAAESDAPTVAGASRRAPTAVMTPKAIADIRDDEVRALKQREIALRAELTNMRTQLRTAMNEKDSALRKLQQQQQPAGGRGGAARDAGEFDELLKEKDAANRQIDALRLEQAQLGRVRDELRTLDYEGDEIARNIRAADQKARDAKATAERATATRDSLMASLSFKTMSDADDEISRIDGRISAATKKNDMALVKELTKNREKIEKAKKQVQASYAADEDVFKRTEQAAAAEAELNALIERRRAVDGKKSDLRDKLSNRKDFNKEFDKLHTTLRNVRDKMDKIKHAQREDQKKVEKDRDTNSGVNEARAQLDALRSRQDEITKELDAIANKIPSVEVAFTPDLRQEILGRGGATLDQLRTDFGVAIDFTPEKTNCLTIVGAREDIEATKSAMEQMLENLALTRKTATVTFDSSIAPSLIGSRGSNIERIQNISGARVKVTASEGTAHIMGTQEACDAAKAMIEQHVANSASMSMKFDRELRDIVLGKAGATVRKIEEESGAKKVRVDRDLCLIQAFGTQEACDKVKDFYTTLLSDLSGGGMTMKVDQRMIALVIGKGGSTISEIQNATGAIVNVAEGGKVSIRGSRDAVQAARERIEDLTRRDEIKIPFPRVLFDYLVTRPLVAPEGEEGERVQQQERNSPLEEIKFQCGCDQVSAIRAENNVVIRGRRESVNDAKRMLHDLLHELRPETKTVSYPDVLSAYLTRRSGADRLTPLDRVKAEHPGLFAIDLDRRASSLTIAGEKPAVEAATTQFHALFDSLQDKIGQVSVPASAVGAIIGNGGSTIADLQRRHSADINVSRERQLVMVYSAAGKEVVDAVIADVEALAKGAPLPSKAAKA